MNLRLAASHLYLCAGRAVSGAGIPRPLHVTQRREIGEQCKLSRFRFQIDTCNYITVRQVRRFRREIAPRMHTTCCLPLGSSCAHLTRWELIAEHVVDRGLFCHADALAGGWGSMRGRLPLGAKSGGFRASCRSGMTHPHRLDGLRTEIHA